MLIEWKDKYSTGVDDIDFEHQELIELINKLYDEMQSADAANSVPVFFGELFKAISSHFALEETLMRAANYPHFREHKEDHEDLLDELRAIMDDYDAAEGSLPAGTLGKALDVWFTDHFKTHDSKLHEVMGPH